MPSPTLPCSPTPRGFSDLPVELIRMVVHLVKAQDGAFDPLYISRHPRNEKERKAAERNVPRRPGDIAWSAAYGRGVQALSRVNQVLRELTLPFVFEVRSIPSLLSFSPFF
jgi:hypothetical protein